MLCVIARNCSCHGSLWRSWCAPAEITCSETTSIVPITSPTSVITVGPHPCSDYMASPKEIANMLLMYHPLILSLGPLRWSSLPSSLLSSLLMLQPSSTLEGLVLPVVISTLNLVLPFLFSFLAKVERFKTQSGEIKMTLIR